MPASKTLAPKTPQTLASYPVLLRRVRQTLAEGRERAADAVEREKVRTCWETGKLIQEHIFLNKDRAQYGEQVIERLSVDLGMSQTELKYMRQFARTYPEIGRVPDQLSWAHMETLLAVNAADERQVLADKAVSNKWSQKDLRREIKKRKLSVIQEPKTELPEVKPGKIGTYRVVKAVEGPYKGQLALDLGFSNYFRPKAVSKFKEKDLVSLEAGKLKFFKGSDEDRYTYRAYVTKATDGDTFWAVIDLGFEILTEQKLRLRGLDASEIESTDGQKAKAFLEKILKKNKGPVLIKTSKSDKYDRYLADLWAGDRYLNQELLDKGLAVMAQG